VNIFVTIYVVGDMTVNFCCTVLYSTFAVLTLSCSNHPHLC
jgi:hypothetical protein